MEIDNDMIVVGEPDSEVEGKGKAGKVYVFEVGGAAIQSICMSGMFFRSSLAISMSLIICPSPREPLMNRI